MRTQAVLPGLQCPYIDQRLQTTFWAPCKLCWHAASCCCIHVRPLSREARHQTCTAALSLRPLWGLAARIATRRTVPAFHESRSCGICVKPSPLRAPAGKGGKNRRRGKNESEEKRELIFKEDGQGASQARRAAPAARLQHRSSGVYISCTARSTSLCDCTDTPAGSTRQCLLVFLRCDSWWRPVGGAMSSALRRLSVSLL